MKKLLAVSAALFIGVASFAQKKKEAPVAPTMPKNSEKVITYKGVKEVKGTKVDLYKKAKAWFKDYYPNPASVIRTEREESGFIKGRGKYRIYDVDKKGNKTLKGMVDYGINIYIKDGKYKYELTEFYWKQSTRYSIERWEDTTDQYYSKQYVNYLIQTDEFAKDLIAKLNKFMLAPDSMTDGDDW